MLHAWMGVQLALPCSTSPPSAQEVQAKLMSGWGWLFSGYPTPI